MTGAAPQRWLSPIASQRLVQAQRRRWSSEAGPSWAVYEVTKNGMGCGWIGGLRERRPVRAWAVRTGRTLWSRL